MASEKLQKARRVIDAEERSKAAENRVLADGGSEEAAAEAAKAAGAIPFCNSVMGHIV